MSDLELVAQSAGAVCSACSVPAVVQWQRRTTDGTVPVFGCGRHAVSIDLAARVHAASCPAPDEALLPACGCTPEPVPETDLMALAQAPVFTWPT
ncbi:hypothetical protein [Kitasatospora indigofera]|uniref:hypothetical protein n=1 Tax=Kitasatospora indigofera TaxID=67307 RepID=UPI0036C18144